MYRSEEMLECNECYTNTYSTGAAAECTVCANGTVSNDDKTSCGKN